jgi:hypothetical protein
MDDSGKRDPRVDDAARSDQRLVRSRALPRVSDASVQPVGPIYLLHSGHQIDRPVRAPHQQLLRDECGDQKFETILFMRGGGRISGFLDALAVLHHQEACRSSHINEAGRAVRVAQLNHIDLEAPIECHRAVARRWRPRGGDRACRRGCARARRRIGNCADDASGEAADRDQPVAAPVSIEAASETGWKRMRDSGS